MQTDCRKKLLTFGKFIAKLRAATTSIVPAGYEAGYEDETGFRYGANADDGFFLIFDSGEQPRRRRQQRLVIS